MPTTRAATKWRHGNAVEDHSMDPTQRLPNEILSLIAFELAHVGWLQTLGSMCTMSKKHYYLVRPYMYRHLQLFHPDFNPREPTTPTPWRLLHQLVQHVYESDPERFEHVPTDELPPYLRTAAARVQNKTFTPVLERTAMIQTIDIGHIPEPGVVEALDLMISKANPGAMDNLFSRLRMYALWGSLWDRDSYIDFEEYARIVGGIMHPARICVHYPTPNPWQPAENQSFEPDAASIDLEALIGERSYITPPLRGITLHNLGTDFIPIFSGPKELRISVYFATPHRMVQLRAEDQVTGTRPYIKELMIKRCEQIDELALHLDPRQHEPSYSFHGVLRDEDILELVRVDEEQELVTAEVNSKAAPEIVLRDIYMEHLRQIYPSPFISAWRQEAFHRLAWPEFKAILENRFTFCPAPLPNNTCSHCRRPVVNWTPQFDDPERLFTEAELMKLPVH